MSLSLRASIRALSTPGVQSRKAKGRDQNLKQNNKRDRGLVRGALAAMKTDLADHFRLIEAALTEADSREVTDAVVTMMRVLADPAPVVVAVMPDGREAPRVVAPKIALAQQELLVPDGQELMETGKVRLLRDRAQAAVLSRVIAIEAAHHLKVVVAMPADHAVPVAKTEPAQVVHRPVVAMVAPGRAVAAHRPAAVMVAPGRAVAAHRQVAVMAVPGHALPEHLKVAVMAVPGHAVVAHLKVAVTAVPVHAAPEHPKAEPRADQEVVVAVLSVVVAHVPVVRRPADHAPAAVAAHHMDASRAAAAVHLMGADRAVVAVAAPAGDRAVAATKLDN